MTEKEKALAAIRRFVDDWAAKQSEYEQADPESYEGVTAADWELWFWESGGDL